MVMKNLALVFCALLLVAIVTACGSSGSPAGYAGESCVKHSDCQDGLACVGQICKPSTDGDVDSADNDTSTTATDGDKWTEAESETDISIDGDDDTDTEAVEYDAAFYIKGANLSTSIGLWCHGVELVVAKKRAGGIAGWGGVTAVCGGDGMRYSERLSYGGEAACDDFFDEMGGPEPSWLSDDYDYTVTIGGPDGEYIVMVRFSTVRSFTEPTKCLDNAPAKIIDAEGNECLSYDIQSDIGYSFNEYPYEDWEEALVFEKHDYNLWRDVAMLEIKGGKGVCSNVTSLLERDLFIPEPAIVSPWELTYTNDGKCNGVVRRKASADYLNPRAVEDPALKKQSALPASAWCYPHDDPKCVAREAAAQAASYPLQWVQGGDFGDLDALSDECTAIGYEEGGSKR